MNIPARWGKCGQHPAASYFWKGLSTYRIVGSVPIQRPIQMNPAARLVVELDRPRFDSKRMVTKKTTTLTPLNC